MKFKNTFEGLLIVILDNATTLEYTTNEEEPNCSISLASLLKKVSVIKIPVDDVSLLSPAIAPVVNRLN